MGIPSQAVTPWTNSAGPGICCDPLPENLNDMIQVASEILFELSGRRWPGARTDVVRPCARSWTSVGAIVPPGWTTTLDLSAGGWYGWAGMPYGVCGCTREVRCGCVALSEIVLPEYPVTGITTVTIDGELVDPGNYRLDDDRSVVWIGTDENGRTGWPCCQDLEAATTDADTFEITYVYGQAPPMAGAFAAGAFACELALACDPASSGRCRLPKRVQSIVRSGVTFDVGTDRSIFTEGYVGLEEVDSWLGAIRYGQTHRQAFAFLPDMPDRFRRTDTSPSS